MEDNNERRLLHVSEISSHLDPKAADEGRAFKGDGANPFAVPSSKIRASCHIFAAAF